MDFRTPDFVDFPCSLFTALTQSGSLSVRCSAVLVLTGALRRMYSERRAFRVTGHADSDPLPAATASRLRRLATEWRGILRCVCSLTNDGKSSSRTGVMIVVFSVCAPSPPELGLTAIKLGRPWIKHLSQVRTRPLSSFHSSSSSRFARCCKLFNSSRMEC